MHTHSSVAYIVRASAWGLVRTAEQETQKSSAMAVVPSQNQRCHGSSKITSPCDWKKKTLLLPCSRIQWVFAYMQQYGYGPKSWTLLKWMFWSGLGRFRDWKEKMFLGLHCIILGRRDRTMNHRFHIFPGIARSSAVKGQSKYYRWFGCESIAMKKP